MKLYKYRSNSRNTYSELLNKKIWFSSFSELNDPCEGLYVNKSGKEDFDYLMRSIQICCFSKSISSHVLWAHYANSHKGLSYEFDIAGQEVNALMDVVYNNEMPIINEIRKYPIGHAHEGKLEVNINEEGKIFRNKSPEWFYEREVRICAISDELSKKGKLLPFLGMLT